jgi:outer membrane lipoprotein SlyB
MKRIHPGIAGIFGATIALGACVQTPLLPTIPVAPGPSKTFDAFAADQASCQQYAAAQTAPAVAAANNQALGGAILTTALGAGLGGAIGGGRGAGIGAASGAALGTVAGAGSSGSAQMSLQQQYDILYGQCMAAHGNSAPGFSSPPGTPYAGSPSSYSSGSRPYSGGPSPYAGGPPPYAGGPPPSGAGYYSGAPVPPPPGY